MTNLSWDNVEEILEMYDDGEAYEELCAQSKPSDFYVAVDQNKMVYITPCAYFDKTGYQFDQHMDLADILPEYVVDSDEMEGVWMDTSPATSEEVLADLIGLGFKCSADFTAMVM